MTTALELRYEEFGAGRGFPNKANGIARGSARLTERWTYESATTAAAATNWHREGFDWLVRRWPWVLAAYVVAASTIRLIATPTLTVDEADQMFFSQALRWGYDDQPPLYTWVVHLLFRITGPSLAVLTAVKCAVLLAFHLFTYHALRRWAGPLAACLGSAGVLLVYQIGWETLRDLTHTNLALAALAGLFFSITAALQSKRRTAYGGIALALAVGLLAKQNFALVSLALLTALLILPSTRRQLNLPLLLTAVLTALALAAPAYVWHLNHPGVALEDTTKFETAGSQVGPFTLAWESLLALALGLVSCFAIVGPSWFVMSKGFLGRRESMPIGRALFLATSIALFMTAAGLIAFGATNVQARWLVLTVYMALLWFPLTYGRTLPNWAHWPLPAMALIKCGIVLVGLAIAFRYSTAMGFTSHMQTPFYTLAHEVLQDECDPDAVVSVGHYLSGNMRRYYPGVPVVTSYFVPETPEKPETLLLVWQGKSPLSPAAALDTAQAVFGVEAKSVPVETVDLPQLFADPQEARQEHYGYRCAAVARPGKDPR